MLRSILRALTNSFALRLSIAIGLGISAFYAILFFLVILFDKEEQWSSEVWSLLWKMCVITFAICAVIGLIVVASSSEPLRRRKRRREERRHAVHELTFTGVNEWSLAELDRSTWRWKRIRRRARGSQLLHTGRRTLLFPFLSIGYAAQQAELLKIPILGKLGFVARAVTITLTQMSGIFVDVFTPPSLILGTVIEVRELTPDEQGTMFGTLLGMNRPAARVAAARALSFRSKDVSDSSPADSEWVFMTSRLEHLLEPGDEVVFVVAPGSRQAFSRLALLEREANPNPGRRRFTRSGA